MSDQPSKLTRHEATRVIREIAADTSRIVEVPHARKRAKQRRVTRVQIERCVQRGSITEGPFLNAHGDWQVNIFRHAAGEELTCVVAIEWREQIAVITVF